MTMHSALQRLLPAFLLFAVMALGFTAGAGADVLELPADLTTIADEAFYNDKSLDVVILPEGTKAIWARAFANSSLTEIYLPGSVNSIANDAFAGSSLERVSAPYNCYAYKWALNRGYIQPETDASLFTYSSPSGSNVSITGFVDETNYPASIVLPITSPDGYRVNGVGDSAFKGLTGLTSVVAEYNITFIGADAFKGCTGLTKVSFSEGLLSIAGTVNYDDGAFSGCTSLTKVVIPSTVASIANHAFHNCSNLEHLVIRRSASTQLSIGSNAFSGTKLSGRLTLPAKVKSIGASAFSGTLITELVIEKGDYLTSIGESAFYACRLLNKVTIPGNVATIGADAFKSCDHLSSLKLSEGLKMISGTVNYDDGAFSGCTALTHVTIPGTVETIANYAFHNCSSLTMLDITDSDEHQMTIGSDAFSGTGLNGMLILPAKVKSIGASAFAGVPIITLKIDAGDHLTTIGDSAFKGCPELTTVILPGNVTTIGPNTFRACVSLKNLTLPEGLKTLSGSVNYNDGAFGGCTSLSSVTLPGTLEKVSNYSFKGCSSLTKLTIRDNADHPLAIGTGAFEGTALTGALTIPGKVKSIEGSAFSGTSITSLNIQPGENLTAIGSGAFRNCKELTIVSIPDNVTTISTNAFRSCEKLVSISFGKGLKRISGSINYNEGAFCDCTSLERITLPASITSIGNYSFYNCTSLLSITIKAAQENVSIGSNAFGKCPGQPVFAP